MKRAISKTCNYPPHPPTIRGTSQSGNFAAGLHHTKTRTSTETFVFGLLIQAQQFLVTRSTPPFFVCSTMSFIVKRGISTLIPPKVASPSVSSLGPDPPQLPSSRRSFPEEYITDPTVLRYIGRMFPSHLHLLVTHIGDGNGRRLT